MLEGLRVYEIDKTNQSLVFNSTAFNETPSYFGSGLLSRIESFDYGHFQERALDIALQPYNYVMHEVPL